MKKILVLMLLMGLLSACGSTTTNMMQNTVVVTKATQVVDLADVSAQERMTKLNKALETIEEVNGTAVIVANKSHAGHIMEIKTALMNSGYDSDNISIIKGDNESFEVVLSNYVFSQTLEDKDRFDQEWFSDKQVRAEYGAATNYNLAKQIVDPQDLINPKEHDVTNALSATGAVEAYQKGAVKALLDTNPSTVGGQ